MAENLRDALRDFALQKMRDLETERVLKSKKDDKSDGKNPKSTKIKINRVTSQMISGSSKKAEDSQIVKSDSTKNTKRHLDESNSGDSGKVQKLMRLYEIGESIALTPPAEKGGSGSVKSPPVLSVPKRTTDFLAKDEASIKEQDGTKTKKHSELTKVMKGESSTVEPQFKSLLLGQKEESDVEVGAEKKSVPMSGEKKMIKINIQTKLLELQQEPEKVAKDGSGSDSDSSSDDDGNDSDDDQVALGLPWRTILEDGELSETSHEEEEEDVKETAGNEEKAVEEEKEVLEKKGEDKKKSSKHKHKSKHKKHKHKKSKKKKSKHKHKDRKEKDSASDLKNEGGTTSEQGIGEERDSKASENETIDIKHKGDKRSSSRRRSKDEKQKESRLKDAVSEERKSRSSSSSSRKTSEERGARETRDEDPLREDVKKDKRTKTEERSHGERRSCSKEKSRTKDMTEDKKRKHENVREEATGRKDQVRDKEEKKRYEEKTDDKRERRSGSIEKLPHDESCETPKKTEEDDKCVPLSKQLEGSTSGTKEKQTGHQKEECKSNIGSDEKAKPPKIDSNEESKTLRESADPTCSGGSYTITFSNDDSVKTSINSKSDSSHKSEKKSHDERKTKEEQMQKDTRKSYRREEEKKDATKEKSRHEESRKGEKRHKEKRKEKDREDKKQLLSKKHQVSTKVKIDHLEHDFPSAEEYAEDPGDKVQSEKKDDMKSEISATDKTQSSEIQAALDTPIDVVVSPLDNDPAANAVKEKEKLKEENRSADNTKEQVDVTSGANATTESESSINSSCAVKSKVTQDERSGPSDTVVKDSATAASSRHIEFISSVKDSSPTPAKQLESSDTKVENVSKIGIETSGDVDDSEVIDNTEAKLSKSSESARQKEGTEDQSGCEQKEEGAVSTTSSTEKPNKNAESIEKAVESKDVKKESDKTSKKRKKDKSDDKEEGAIDSEIEEGEITKKHKKSKKKDKKKDRSERDKKDRTERDKSGRERSDHRDKHKRRHSDSRSESRSHSRSHKRHKGSPSKSRSDDDGDSDISIGTTKMVEKSYFSESRGCWVTRMVPKEDDSPSPEVADGNEPYDIGDTYIRHPAHDRRSVFDRLGGGSSSHSRGRFNDRRDRNPRYGYSRRRGRSYSRSHSRSRSRSRSPKFHIDKKKLLEIAKANALMRMRAGDLPSNLPITESMKKAADSFEVNESIQKFTDRCKALANLQGGSSDDDSPVNRPVGSDDEDEDGNEAQKPFVRHPFKVKEAAPIVMNIRNAIQIPVASKDNLRVQFPVSCGSQHRKKEVEIVIGNANDPYGQWKTVEKPMPKPAAAPTTKASTTQPPATPVTTPATPSTTPATQTTPAASVNAPAAAATVAPVVAGPHIPGLTNSQPPQPVPEKDKVFEDSPGFSYDIGQIVSARLKAARALQSNPNNVEALTVLHHSQKQIQTWAHSSKKPGLFTGSTDATFLRPEELGNPNRKNQAWIRKDMFLTAAPVNTDIGRSLMHKMGWKQGEGLGKNKEGALNPLLLEIKTDRQGLVAAEEKPKKKGDVSKVIRKDLSGKHPVMALNELCNKRRWGKPNFEVVREDGPPHKKNFVFKVCIRNDEYIPTVCSGNKKDAKAMAATVALQKMGLLPH